MLDKIKQLSIDTLVYGISTIIGRFLGFLLIPLYTNVFSEYLMGVYGNIYAYMAFFNIAYIYGMDAAFLKFASLKSEKEQKTYFSTAYKFVALTTIIISVIFYTFKIEITQFIEVPKEFQHLIIYTIVILLLDTFAIIPFSSLRLKNKSKKFAAIKTGNIIINLGLNLLLIFKFNMGIESIFISNIVASLFSLLCLISEIIKNVKGRFNYSKLKQMLKFGLPYLPASVAATVVQVIDRPILAKLTNNETVGLYTANYKLGVFMMLFVAMFQYAWQPFFLNNAKEKNVKEIFSKVLTLFVVIASVIWVFLSLFIKDLASIEFVNGKSIIGYSFLSGLDIVPIILLAYLFHGMYVNFTAGIYIKEKTSYMPFITGAGAVSNIVANFLLIPAYGIMGAAYATLASYFTMCLLIFITSQSFYKVNYEYSKILKTFIIMGVVAVIYFWKREGYTILYKSFIFIAFIVSLIFSGVVKLSEINKILILLKIRK